MEVPQTTSDMCVVLKYNVIVTERIHLALWNLRLGVSDLSQVSNFDKSDCEECTLTCIADRRHLTNVTHIKVFYAIVVKRL